MFDERRRRADREPADLVRGREIALEQRRRQLQHAGDVVEAVARVVGRQELATRRRRGRAGREPRCGTRRGSGGGTARCGRDSGAAAAAAVELALEPGRRARARSAGSGRGSPAGGIMPARSLRTTFSHSCACAATSASGSDFRLRSAVRSTSSWQLVTVTRDGRAVLLDELRVAGRLAAREQQPRRRPRDKVPVLALPIIGRL